jgi:hypothetical protein
LTFQGFRSAKIDRPKALQKAPARSAESRRDESKKAYADLAADAAQM